MSKGREAKITATLKRDRDTRVTFEIKERKKKKERERKKKRRTPPHFELYKVQQNKNYSRSSRKRASLTAFFPSSSLFLPLSVFFASSADK